MPINFVREPDGAITTFAVANTSGSFANSINPEGIIARYDYVVITKPSFKLRFHAFVRESDGTITTFDVTGAVDIFTSSNSINPAGVIAGYYYDTNNASPGYVRALDGAFETLDVRVQAPGLFRAQALFYVVVNPMGLVGGIHVDAKSVYRGFVRSYGDSVTTFDSPGSAGTFPDSINLEGVIAGYYEDANNAGHGFLRLGVCNRDRIGEDDR